MKKPTITFLLFTLFITIVYAQPKPGYYDDAEGKSEAALKTALYNIIKGHRDLGYDGLYTIYPTSDNTSDDKVWDMYSTCTWTHGNKKCGSYKNVCDCYNREHSIPQSWFNERSPMRNDAFHVYPTDGKVNGMRSNHPFGECSGGSTLPNGKGRWGRSTFPGYSGTVFEPDDEYKGDFARTYFYFATRYQDIMTSIGGDSFNNTTYPSFTGWSQELFLKWHRQDPVSQKELDRNNAVEAFQRNRNPFIDYPNLAEHIWGDRKGESWSSSATDDPRITDPARGTLFDMGTIAYLHKDSITIYVKGVNLTGDLSTALSDQDISMFSTATNTISEMDALAGYDLKVYFTASDIGERTVTLTISGGGVSPVAVNVKAYSTDDFMALPATYLSSVGFTANWTLSAGAEGYELDVYSLVNSSGTEYELYLEEDFNGSLPAGWSTGGYTNLTDQPGAIRLASGSSNGSVTTPTINFGEKESLLTVQAKQYNNDTGAALTAKLDDGALTVWQTESTSKEYTVEIPAPTASGRITLSASAGKRIYLEHMKVESKGSTSEKISVTGYPKPVGDVLSYTVTGLESDSLYYYTVTPEGNGVAESNAVAVRTNPAGSDLPELEDQMIFWFISDGTMYIYNLPENSSLRLIDISGKSISFLNGAGIEEQLVLPQRGVYLLQVVGQERSVTYKILY